jgi:RNA-dependent RNA polymerase
MRAAYGVLSHHSQGLLLRHPGMEENDWTYPCVWLRPSQIKIRRSDSFMHHPAHCIIDLLRGSHMRSPIQISREMITNLGENGVPHTIFAELFRNSLSSTIDSLLDWDGLDAMPRLWNTIAKDWNVMSGRIARESSWTARARGVRVYDQEDDSEDEEADDADSPPRSTAWWGDDISGCPSTLEETVMTFLDSGFHPASNSILAEKLHIMVKNAVKARMGKYRVKIPMSCAAFIVPGTFLPPDISLITNPFSRSARSATGGRNSREVVSAYPFETRRSEVRESCRRCVGMYFHLSLRRQILLSN